METLFWETHNNALFNVFIRDLSMSLNTNLKHMILDNDKISDNDKLNSNITNKNLKSKKPKPMKKKDLIIQEQNKKRIKKLLDDDLMKIDYAFKNINENNFMEKFNYLKTVEAKQVFKMKLLDYFIKLQKEEKRDYMSQILILYYSLKYGKNEYIINDEKYIKLSKRLDKKLSECDVKSYLMKECSDLLPPLNFWDKGEYKLDDWQKHVINFIKNKTSVLVRAPTSAGKTFVAMATGILHHKILYVCPAKPVAFQVGANFRKMGHRVHYLLENMAHLSYDSKTNIFIGTPDIIEQYLPRIYTDFDYAVFDEIHNLNNMIQYENIIKLLKCSFLALSATIENIDRLKFIFQRIHSKKHIEYVEYNKRFINIQRWIYDEQLSPLHPLACFDMDFHSIINIPFTPKDLIDTYETIYDIFERDDLEDEIEYLSPDNYFKEDKLLTLDDTKDYELFIKYELVKLQGKYPQYMKTLVEKYQKKEYIPDENNIIQLLKDCKSKDLLPMLYFHTREEEAKEIFLNLHSDLKREENAAYPFHYDILKKKSELYQKFIEKRQVYSDSIKIKTNDSRSEKSEKMNQYDKDQRYKYISDMTDYYIRCIGKCEGLQMKNLIKERDKFLENPDFRDVDVFKKHQDYVFSRGEPMSGDEIRSIRREIKKSIGLTIDYENPYFQLLKRGIGLYISSMPDVYNWILQRLMSEKKLGIIISDKTLCLGIDLPIRSVALSGYNNPNYTTSDYLQMSGRAGRRGHDTQGNIIFHNVPNYLNLMKNNLPKITGSKTKLGDSYSLLKDMNKNIDMKHLSWRIDNSEQIIKDININPKIHKLGWNLRYYIDTEEVLNEIFRIEKKIFRIDEDSREIWFYRYILKSLTLFDIDKYILIYKSNKILDNITETVNHLIEIGEIHKHIVNSLDNTYMITKRCSRNIFNTIKTTVYKYRGFE
jgi:superfamily II RNA helicase